MIIFLDIDGVLNTHDQCIAGREGPSNCHPIDSGMVSILGRVLTATGARVVLSSAWRYRISGPAGLDEFEFMLRTHGFPEGRLIDCTPRDEDVPGRGNQIRYWIDERQYFGPYAVIDDMEPSLESMDMHPLVTTNPRVGLTEKDAERVIRILMLPSGLHHKRIALS